MANIVIGRFQCHCLHSFSYVLAVVSEAVAVGAAVAAVVAVVAAAAESDAAAGRGVAVGAAQTVVAAMTMVGLMLNGRDGASGGETASRTQKWQERAWRRRGWRRAASEAGEGCEPRTRRRRERCGLRAGTLRATAAMVLAEWAVRRGRVADASGVTTTEEACVRAQWTMRQPRSDSGR